MSPVRRLSSALVCLLVLAPLSSAQVEQGEDALSPRLVSGVVRVDDVDTPRRRVVKLVVGSSGNEDPVPDNPLGPSRRNHRSRVQRIRDIAADDTVDGVLLEVQGIPDMARVIDLLDALYELQGAGKTIACYAETLDRNRALVASMADHLVVPPSGMILMEGLVAESMYLKDMFAKVGLRFEVLHVGEYKTAFEELARDGMSAGQREVIQVILDEYYGQAVETIAAHRELSAEAVDGLFAELFLSPERARELGLVDAVAYRDAFDDSMEGWFGGDVELVEDYGDRTKEDVQKMLENPLALFSMLPALLDPPKAKAPTAPYVGIVYATGTIVSGKSQVDWQGNVTSMGSETIVKALQTMGEDANCKAVVLRVNSPGGSALASDMIWRAVEQVKLAKPVVSSMGQVAASGGYWISMGCNAIVAQPSTLTGSIGVVSMLPDPSTTLDDMGISVEVVSAGPLGDALSILASGPSDVIKDRMTTWMQVTYDEFVQKVSTGRGLEPSVVHALAKGRVWTGRQAEQVGLVDALGGLEEAVAMACAMGGLSVGTAPVYELPRAPSPFEALEESMNMAMAAASTGPVERALIELGFGDLAALARRVAADPSPLSPDRVQALLPFTFTVR